jgi:hypothetical protein
MRPNFEQGESQKEKGLFLEIPELNLHEKAPELSDDAREKLEEQWQDFWEIRMFGNESRDNDEEEKPEKLELKQGDLLHQLKFQENDLSSIFSSGILSGEIQLQDKDAEAEDSETHYCADFFVNQKDQTFADYASFANSSRTSGSLKVKNPESYACPQSKYSDDVALIINTEDESLQSLLENSVSGDDLESLGNFPVQLPYDDADINKRLKAVLVGIPSNFISAIAVGYKIAEDSDKIETIPDMIESNQLDIGIYDSEGNLIS